MVRMVVAVWTGAGLDKDDVRAHHLAAMCNGVGESPGMIAEYAATDTLEISKMYWQEEVSRTRAWEAHLKRRRGEEEATVAVGWTCSVCTFRNEGEESNDLCCGMCGTSKQAAERSGDCELPAAGNCTL